MHVVISLITSSHHHTYHLRTCLITSFPNITPFRTSYNKDQINDFTRAIQPPPPDKARMLMMYQQSMMGIDLDKGKHHHEDNRDIKKYFAAYPLLSRRSKTSLHQSKHYVDATDPQLGQQLLHTASLIIISV